MPGDGCSRDRCRRDEALFPGAGLRVGKGFWNLTVKHRPEKRNAAFKRPPLYLSAAEVMKLPKRDRDRILAKAAILAQEEYRANPALTDFDAFGDEEFHDAHD